MPCPYCDELLFVPDYVVANIEAYGSKVVRFPCTKCKKTIKASAYRRVAIEHARKTDEESDW